MATKNNSAEVGANGDAITYSNRATTTGGTAGDGFDDITITGSPTFEKTTTNPAFGTRAYHISGVSGDVAYPRWALNDTQIAFYGHFRYNGAMPGIGHVLWQTFGGGVVVNLNGSNVMIMSTAGGTLTSAFTGGALSANTDYRLEVTVDQNGQTTTSGILKCALFLKGSSTPVTGYNANLTGVNVGTANMTHARIFGKQLSGMTQDITFDSLALATGTTTMPALPGANIAPTIIAGADQYVVAGVGALNLSGTVTDSDGTVASATWTRVSGPDSPTISTSSSGAGTSTLTATASVDVIPGVYTFQLAGVDNSALAGTPQTMKAYVRPASNDTATPVSATLGAGSNFGSPSSTLVGVSDSNNATGIQSTDNPTADVIGPLVLPPQGLGQVTILNTLSVVSEATAGIVATLKVYKEDGTTLIDTGTRTITSSTPALWAYDLSSAALAAIPALSDRRALRYTLTAAMAP